MYTDQQALREIGSWLHVNLPSYATDHATRGKIEWDRLLDPDNMGRYASSELAAIALAAHATDRGGVLLDIYETKRVPRTIIGLLACLRNATRREWLAIVLLRMVD